MYSKYLQKGPYYKHVTKGQNHFTLNACHDKYSVDQEKPSNFISN